MLVMSSEVETSLDVSWDAIKRLVCRGSCQLPLQSDQCLVHNGPSAIDIFRGVRSGNESRLKLRWREINVALQTGMEKSCEHFQVAPLSVREIDNWPGGKE